MNEHVKLQCIRYLRVDVWIHACMHYYIHTYIHTYVRTYIHTYVHQQKFSGRTVRRGSLRLAPISKYPAPHLGFCVFACVVPKFMLFTLNYMYVIQCLSFRLTKFQSSDDWHSTVYSKRCHSNIAINHTPTTMGGAAYIHLLVHVRTSITSMEWLHLPLHHAYH